MGGGYTMKTKELNKFNALIAVLEKQAMTDLFSFYDLETYDFYIFNEYSVIKLYPAYYQAIQNTRPSLPGVDDLWPGGTAAATEL